MIDPLIDRILFLTSDPPALAAYSGYSLLTRALGAPHVQRVVRRTATSFPDRLLRFAASRLAANNTYQLSSLKLEWLARRQLLTGHFRAAHHLWADSDWGYLDVAARRLGVALLATFHHCSDTLPSVIPRPRRLARLDHCFLMSETQAPFFRTHGVPAHRIHVVHHGVDTSFFRPAPRTQEDSFSVLSVGGYRRNFSLLREICAAMASDDGVRFRLVIPRAFHALFAGMPHVECLTGLSDQDLLTQYQTADCFLMTCENATANNSILEAMACGLPVVSERVGGIPEYVPASGALFADPQSVPQLRGHILDLKSSAASAVEMSRANVARAEHLAWPRVAATMLDLYKRCGIA
jgi:glycosyltransferase involved in cell wall biosynthesis